MAKNRTASVSSTEGAALYGVSSSTIQAAAPVTRRFALFVDGASRAMILPFGPTLVYRLVHGTSKVRPTQWAGLAYYLAFVVAVYIFGRWLGTALSHNYIFANKRKLPVCVSRLGGVAIALQFFTYGAGLTSVRWLVAIRFCSAVLAGLLCGITAAVSLPEDDWVRRNGGKISDEEALRRREGYVDIASGSAKMYLTGFAVSILAGGLLFRKATKDSTFQALTGAYQFSLSPMFLFSVAISAEIVLRRLFSWAMQEDHEKKRSDKTHSVFRRGSAAEKKLRDALSPVSATRSTEHRVVRLVESSDEQSGYHSRESHLLSEEFFDCRSMFSDMELGLDPPEASMGNHANEIAQYVNGRCVYSDGSPAYVPQGDYPGTVPVNYLKFHGQNEDRARKAWEETQRWRSENRVWKINTKPNRWFREIKDAYPHYVHGHSKTGTPVIYEQPGKMKLKDLFRNGCEVDDMVRHYIFFMEYVSNRVCTREELRSKRGPDAPQHNSSSWGTMVVMDLKGCGLSNLSGDVVKYLKRAGEINTRHYPLSMKRAFLINAPFWAAGAFSGLKSLLPESVAVDLLSAANYGAGLREYIDEDQIPPEYGGTSPYPLGEHPYEVEMRNLVDRVKDTSDEDTPEKQTPAKPPSRITIPTAAPSTDAIDVNSKFSPLAGEVSPFRRRGTPRQIKKNAEVYFKDDKYGNHGDQSDVFFIVSGMHVLWSFVQGAIEIAVPLWILSPAVLGGLGYSPSRNGVTMFCGSLVLLWTLRSKSSRLVSQIPSKAPLRAFRIGVGAESALLALLSFVSTSTSADKRVDSVVVMASTIVILSCMALASMIGRSASKILHRIAAESFARQLNLEKVDRSGRRRIFGLSELSSGYETGKFTTLLNLGAEISGLFLAAPLWSWSMSLEPTSSNATCILFVSSLITFVLYVCSFSLHLNSDGEFAPHPKDSCTDSSMRRCLPFVCEAIAVSAGDMASLFEEANWTSTQLLGRSRVFSDTSIVSLEEMERGEAPLSGRRKAR